MTCIGQWSSKYMVSGPVCIGQWFSMYWSVVQYDLYWSVVQ